MLILNKGYELTDVSTDVRTGPNVKKSHLSHSIKNLKQQASVLKMQLSILKRIPDDYAEF